MKAAVFRPIESFKHRWTKHTWAVSALTLLISACAPPTPPQDPRLQVEYQDCSRVLAPADSPTCRLNSSRSLRLWVRTEPDAELTIVTGNAHWTQGDGEPIAKGLRFKLSNLDPGPLRVRASRGGVETTWELPLRVAHQPPYLKQALLSRRKGDSTRAREILVQELVTPQDPVAEALTLSLLARLEQSVGESDRAIAYLRRAIPLHRDQGDLFGQIKDLTMLFDLHYHRDDFSSAWQTLEQLPAPPTGHAQSAYSLAFYRGMVATYTGDARTALRNFERATEQAQRLGMSKQLHMVVQMQAQQWSLLGKHAEAYSALAKIDLLDTDPCRHAELLNNLAWNRLLLWEAGNSVDSMPVQGLPAAATTQAQLQEALKLSDQCGMNQQANIHLNLALFYLHHGKSTQAAQHLAKAQSKTPTQPMWQRVWSHDIQARIALSKGRIAEALQLYDQLLALATGLSSPDGHWRALVGRGRAFQAAGKTLAAAESFAAAEALLDAQSLRVPIATGRQSSVAIREMGTRLYLGLLVREGRNAEAMAVARRARTRFLRGLLLDARLRELADADRVRWSELLKSFLERRRNLDDMTAQAWQVPIERRADLERDLQEQEEELFQFLDTLLHFGDRELLSGDELAGPRANEITLLYHPLPQGWIGFVEDGDGVEVQILADLSPELVDHPQELAEQILEPFTEWIAAAERVRILPYGFLRRVDFHALPFGGDILLAAKTVSYGLDLPPVSNSSSQRKQQAFLVADPTRTLPHALRETEMVDRVLTDRGWEIERSLQASTADVLRALTNVDLLHFAGHADFSGREGWSSGLRLAGGSRLRISEILTSSTGPNTVVLSACESVRESSAGASAGLGLAQTFLLAGSTAVVGAVRPINDRISAQLIADFYQLWDHRTTAAAALRKAQLRLRQSDPNADWASFRVLER